MNREIVPAGEIACHAGFSARFISVFDPRDVLKVETHFVTELVATGCSLLGNRGNSREELVFKSLQTARTFLIRI